MMFVCAHAVIDSHQYHASEQIDMADPEVNTMRLDNLLSERTYRVTIWARTREGGGQSYDVEGTTLPSGREYISFTLVVLLGAHWLLFEKPPQISLFPTRHLFAK